MSTPLEDIVSLAAALDSGFDLAIGSRALPDSRVLIHQPRLRELMGKAFNLHLRLVTGIPWRDTQCGFKLFRLETTRALFEAQQIEGFAFDAEICLRARRLGLKLAEVPVHWSNDSATHVGLGRSSLQMGIDILRIRRIVGNTTEPDSSSSRGERRGGDAGPALRHDLDHEQRSHADNEPVPVPIDEAPTRTRTGG